MLNSSPAIVFSASGRIETYLVPATGGYIIEAAGAEAPEVTDPVSRLGDRIKGMFYLNRGDILKILVGGHRRDDGSRESEVNPGGSIIWRGAGDLFLPAQLMLAAAGGGPRQVTPMGFGREGVVGSFNAGAFQVNQAHVQIGDGCVTLVPVSAPVACGTRDEVTRFAGATAATQTSAPASEVRAPMDTTVPSAFARTVTDAAANRPVRLRGQPVPGPAPERTSGQTAPRV